MGTSLGGVPASSGAQLPLKHLPPEQQPSLQVLPAQQMSPRVPQRAHTPSLPALVQARPALHWSATLLPGQQIWPESPQGVQLLFLHNSPAKQVFEVFGQQGWLAPPQPEQRLA
jgi:hypothetical protein